MRPRWWGLLAGWLTSRADPVHAQRAVYPVNVKALAMRAQTSPPGQLLHSCDMRPGHGKGLVRLYAPRETNSAHASTTSENPDPRRRKCRRTCAQSSDHFGCQLPPDSQTPLFPLPGEKQHHQCLDRRPIRTTTDGHVVQTTKPTFHRWVAHAPSPGCMSNPGPNWATTWSPT